MLEDSGYYYRQQGDSSLSKRFDQRMFEWNERCYNAIRDALVKHNCMTEENKKHLYNNIWGNLLYSIELLVINSNVKIGEVKQILRKYTQTSIMRTTLTNINPSSFEENLYRKCIYNERYTLFYSFVKFFNFLRSLKK